MTKFLTKTELKINDLTVSINEWHDEAFLVIMDKAGFCFSKDEARIIYKLLQTTFEQDEQLR